MGVKAVHCLVDWKQVQAIAHPIRMRILEALSQQAMSPLDLSKVLALKSTTLYHHVETLHDAGLIEVVSERQLRGCVEKTYGSIARDFVLDRGVVKTPSECPPFDELLIATLEAALADAKEQAYAGHLGPGAVDQVRVLRKHFRATTETLAALNLAIDRVLEALEPVSPGSEDSVLTLAIHPLTKEESA